MAANEHKEVTKTTWIPIPLWHNCPVNGSGIVVDLLSVYGRCEKCADQMESVLGPMVSPFTIKITPSEVDEKEKVDGPAVSHRGRRGS